MSEVTEAHGSTGGVPDGGPHEVDGDDQYSGYLCGVCEEPLPYGAATCIACGTPVAPLEDEEMIAGPYVFTGPQTGEVQAIDVDDPYAPPAGDATDAPEPAAAETPLYDLTANGADGAGSEPVTWDSGHASAAFTAPAFAPEHTNGTNGSADAAAPPEPIAPPKPRVVPPAGDPAQAIGIERPGYPEPPVADPGPDPMLGRAPTAPVLSPPPPLPPSTPRPPHSSAGLNGGRREKTPSESGIITPVVVGVAAAVVALLAVGGIIYTRDGSPSSVAAPPTTVSAPSAPAPSVARPVATPDPGAASKAADTETFCLAAFQFRLDPNPDSVAAKFLSNPTQLIATVEALVRNAPPDVRPAMVPLQDAVYSLAGRVRSGEIKTVPQLRLAVDAVSQSPAWPRFDLVIAPAITQHCQKFL